MAYATDGGYWKLDDAGIEYKRPLSEEEVERKKEEDAKLKAQYERVLGKKKG